MFGREVEEGAGVWSKLSNAML